MQYGLIGEHLVHSFSKDIHGQIGDYLYELTEIPLGQLDAFMERRDFKGINVTIPYKQDVIPHLKDIHPDAAAIGAVNTVVNREGDLYGYNTDFGGMRNLILEAGICLEGKKVLILGTGGTCATAQAVAQSLGAAEIYKVSRSEKPGVLTYGQVEKDHRDAQILINTTPRGMFSREGGMAVDPADFPRLCGVVDVVYNPLRTPLVTRARNLGIPAAGGLYMLVSQAVLASQIFFDTQYPRELTEGIYRKLLAGKENIVLTGMPGSGKTEVGKRLAQKLGRPFLDTDERITEKTGLTPAQLITQRGEAAFRQIESEVILALAPQNGAVIATGGGAILRSENVDALKANGRLFFLDRPLEQLIPTQDRPLSSTREAITQRYHERYATYRATADVVIPNDTTPEKAVALIERNFFL